MKLHRIMRPIVEFDVKNKVHRKEYAQFLATGSWSHSAVRYEVDESCGELQAVIQRKLLEYYAIQEFKSVAKKPQRRG